MSFKGKCLAVALAAGLIGIGPWMTSSQAAPNVTGIRLTMRSWIPPTSPVSANGATAAALNTTVPEFKYSVNDHGTPRSGHIVGKNPRVALTNQVTTIKTQVIPVVVNVLGATFDPRATDSCDSTDAMTRIMNSPIFKKQMWKQGGTTIGFGQYVDSVQRAQFWKFTKPTGVNPGYHVTLDPKRPTVVTLDVPDEMGAILASTSCGNGQLGGFEVNWFMNQLQTQIFPTLKKFGVAPTTFPLFVLYNTVMFNGSPSNCCIGGFHNSFMTANGQQTYGVAMYDNTQIPNFAGGDVAVMSHEVSEWMNDPGVGQGATINLTDAWGHIGQVTSCQGNLETGDPLSGHVFADTLNGKTYHLQELAYFSWFFHQSPSWGLGGTYSFRNRFKGFAKPCPPGGTN
jgi:hypothetical protein